MAMRTITLRHSEMDRDQEPLTVQGGELEILSSDGRSLFIVRQNDDGSIEVSTGLSVVRHNGVMLDSEVGVFPRGNGTVVLRRSLYTA